MCVGNHDNSHVYQFFTLQAIFRQLQFFSAWIRDLSLSLCISVSISLSLSLSLTLSLSLPGSQYGSTQQPKLVMLLLVLACTSSTPSQSLSISLSLYLSLSFYLSLSLSLSLSVSLYLSLAKIGNFRYLSSGPDGTPRSSTKFCEKTRRTTLTLIHICGLNEFHQMRDVVSYAIIGSLVLSVCLTLSLSLSLSLLIPITPNIIAFTYFKNQTKDLSTSLYMIITTVDLLLCGGASIVAANFFAQRQGLLFSFSWFCWTWRILFKNLQRLSVFLVLILSISRTTLLVFPVYAPRKKTVLLAICIYCFYLVCESFVLESRETMIYTAEDVYCYEAESSNITSVVNDALHTFSLLAPLPVIVISCVMSVCHVRRTMQVSSHYDLAGTILKQRATITVILFTVVYLVFNIPLIVNLILWITTVQVQDDGWPGCFYGLNNFTYNYFWNVTDVLFVGMNAVVNPLIYFSRFPNCKRWTKSRINRAVGRVWKDAVVFKTRDVINLEEPRTGIGSPLNQTVTRLHLPRGPMSRANTTLFDLLLCGGASIVAANFFAQRQGLLFSFSWFCWTWRILFKNLQRLSVFLVLILSISRTTLLVFPVYAPRKKTVLLAICIYCFYLVCESFVLESRETMIYTAEDVYCYEAESSNITSVVNDALHTFSLLAPLPVIVISCVMSVCHVRRTMQVSSHYDLAGTILKQRATITVILFTVVYLVFNIPLIVNLILWITTVQVQDDGWPGCFYGLNNFTYNYFWNVTDVLFVGMNAVVNPLIYFSRFPNCKRWTKSRINRAVGRVWKDAVVFKTRDVINLEEPRTGIGSPLNQTVTRLHLPRGPMSRANTTLCSSPNMVMRNSQGMIIANTKYSPYFVHNGKIVLVPNGRASLQHHGRNGVTLERREAEKY
eukprot:sb/3461895/